MTPGRPFGRLGRRLRPYAALIAAIGSIATPIAVAVITKSDDGPKSESMPVVTQQLPTADRPDPEFCVDALDAVLDFAKDHPRAARVLVQLDTEFQLGGESVTDECGNPGSVLEEAIEP